MLSYNLTTSDHLTPTYVTHLWQFLSHINATIEIPGLKLQSPQRLNDLFIMDIATQFYSGKQLRHINRCRMYMQVITMADIVTASGSEIEKWATTGGKIKKSTWQWPKCPPPITRIMENMEILRTITTRSSTPLGQWCITPHTIANHQYTLIDDKIIETKHMTQILYKRSETSYTDFLYESARPRIELINSQPVQCKKISSTQLYLNSRPQIPRVSTPSTNLIQAICLHHPQWVRNFLGQTTLPEDDGKAIADEIARGTMKCGSDGSVKNGVAGFGYTFMLHNDTFSLDGHNRCHNSAHLPSSLQGEMEGLLATMIIINSITKLHDITTGNCNIYIDNKETVSRLQNNLKPHKSIRKQFLRPEFNTEHLITEIKRKLPITCTGIWIKSHTSDDTPGHRINRRADILAKEGSAQSQAPDSSFPGASQYPTLFIENQRVTANDMSSIQEHCSKRRIETYLQQTGYITDQLQRIVKWNTIQLHDPQMSHKHQHFLTKLITRWLPTRDKKHSNIHNDGQFPCCRSSPETS